MFGGKESGARQFRGGLFSYRHGFLTLSRPVDSTERNPEHFIFELIKEPCSLTIHLFNDRRTLIQRVRKLSLHGSHVRLYI